MRRRCARADHSTAISFGIAHYHRRPACLPMVPLIGNVGALAQGTLVEATIRNAGPRYLDCYKCG